MDRLKDKSRRNIKVVQDEKMSDKDRHRMDIIKSLKKAELSTKDIEYIINGLNDIDEMIQNKKRNN